MLKLNTIPAHEGATHRRKRLGRGNASGQGGTSGRGHKGQKARKSGNVRPGFEGGQTPLYRRLPKIGFKNGHARSHAVLNLAEIEKMDGTEFNLETLIANKKIKRSIDRLVVLGNGELSKTIKVKAHRVSASAVEKIKKAGGEVEIIPTPGAAEHTLKRKQKKK